MKLMRNSRLRLTLLFSITALLILPACVSRYKLELFQTIEAQSRKTKIDESLFVENTVLGDDPMADAKLDIGPGNCLVLTTSSRGKQLKSDPTESLFLGFFEELRCKLYIELPEPVTTGRVALKDNSLVQLLGKYEVPLEDKIFLPTEGALVIDSIVNMKKMFGTIDGRYENRHGEKISYNGRFKVKIGN